MSLPINTISREDFSKSPLLSRLLELHDIPEKIYIQGKLPDVEIDEYGRATPRILTVVGSRKYTSYGKQVVEKLLSSLHNESVIIVSGLALGIDGLAHKSALKNNLKTIAIPGSGLNRDKLYPSTHISLSEEILENDGALLSELTPDTPASQWTFPARNRIMAALSDAVLIIEAQEKSGTLITARLALELGKDIGAVPGEIFSQTSTGTNMLIHEGAYSIGSVDDLYALLHISKSETTNEKENIDYSAEEKILLEILREPMEKDRLLIESKFATEKFLVTLSSLEMKGVIEETFGEVKKIV